MSELVVRTKYAKFLALREEMKQLKEQLEDAKEDLRPYLDESRENAAGSKVMDLERPVEVGGKVYTALQNTRKVKRTLNQERVFEWLTSGPQVVHYDDVVVTVKHIDPDALWELFVHDVLNQEELDSFFDETVTWAVTPISD